MGYSTTLGSTPTYIAADPKAPKEILNVAGGTVYYKITNDVDSEDTAITSGNTAQISAGNYFISASSSEIVVRELEVTSVEDIVTIDDVTVGDDAEVKGKLTVEEGATVKGTDGIVASGNGGKDTLALSNTTADVGLTIGADSNLYRPEANTLKTDDALKVAGALSAEGAATVGTTLGVTGATTPTGGVVPAGGFPGVYAGGWAPPTAESGTDTKLVEKKLFLVSAFLPANKKLTGVAILVGATGAKGKVVAALFDATGKVLAKSSETEEGTALGTAKEIQKLAFTSQYEAVGPKTFFIGLTGNGVEEGTFRTIPANVASDNIWTAEKELAEKCKMADFAEPPSTFTAAKGPVAVLY